MSQWGREEKEMSLRATEKDRVRFHPDQETGDQRVTAIHLHSILVPPGKQQDLRGEKAMGDLERLDSRSRGSGSIKASNITSC